MVPLGEVCKTTSGGTPSRKNPDYFIGSIPWLKSGELPDGPVADAEETISEEALRTSSAKLFPSGTLLIALYGATVGKLGILTKPSATNQAVCAIFPPVEIETKFLFWFLRFKRTDLVAQAVGGAQPNISQGIIRSLEIPMPTLDQQKRIVAEIEKQFSRLDEAVANLKRVKANLKRYKAAVLKAAVEGRLVETEAERARREGRSFETGAQLLQRILETRRSQWQGKGKYKEPAALDAADLPELPEGWIWASLDQLTSKITSGSRDWSQYYGRGTGIFVLAQNVRPFNPDFSVQQFVDPPSSDSSCDRSRIQNGDLLATIVGANAGQICLVSNAPSDAYVCQSVALIRPVLLGIGAHLNYWLNSAENGQRYLDQCMYGQGRPHLSFEQLMVAPIALPPLAEQQRIVAEVDRCLSLTDESESQVNANLLRAERLRQSILSRAFNPAMALRDGYPEAV
ncbi:MAG TPA: restriction endonuclease subunit S [Thiobacillus sp.]